MTDAAAAPLPHELLRADALPARERFAVWREAVLPLFDCASPGGEAFSAGLEGYDLRQTLIAECHFSPLRFNRPARHAPAQGADHLLVQLYLAGGYAGDNGRHAVKVGAGDISLLDLAYPLATQAGASRTLSVVLPRALLDGAAPRRGWTPGTVLRAGTPLANILGQHLLAVWHNLPRVSQAEAEAINGLLAGVVGTVFAGAAVGGAPLAGAAGRATVAAIRDYILQHLDDPALTPAQLCRRFGCSRSQLYRLFAEEGGIAGLIRSARLERCRDALLHAEGDVRILDVALRWGFDSHSHFCRLFRRAFGTSPGEALEQGRAARRDAALMPRRSAPYRPAFQRWLQQLRVE